MTARRDLKELEEQGKLITHGGAALPRKKKMSISRFSSAQRLTLPEAAIAAKARSFLKAGQHIFRFGTTVHAFAQSLKEVSLTVITDAVNISYELSAFSNIHLLSVGGELRPNSLTLTGKIAEENLSFSNGCGLYRHQWN